MSRIGKKPILIPESVEVKIEGSKVIAKGPKGELSREIRPEINVEMKEGKIFVSSRIEGKKTKAFLGLTRSLLFNMVEGVVKEFEKKLEIEGIGFKAAMIEENLSLSVGFSHPVRITAPSGIKFLVEKNIITISGADKMLVGHMASKIRKIKPAEPYKGKGIKYLGEIIRRKLGKKAAAAATGR